MARHGFDWLSFIFGLLFVGVGLVLLGDGPLGGSGPFVWVGPAAAIGIGLVVVLAARPQPNDRDEEAPGEASGP